MPASPSPSTDNYNRGNQLGQTIRNIRADGGDYDPRFDIADEAKSLTRDEFNKFMDGLNAALTTKDKP